MSYSERLLGATLGTTGIGQSLNPWNTDTGTGIDRRTAGKTKNDREQVKDRLREKQIVVNRHNNEEGNILKIIGTVVIIRKQ